MNELSSKDAEIKKYYDLQDNGFYKLRILSDEERSVLKENFKRLDFSALSFTDSRSRYQFYNLAHLWRDLQIALDAELTLWHPATEPVSEGELYEYLEGKKFVNELGGVPADYNYRTVNDSLFGGINEYIANKREVLQDIKKFIQEEGNKSKY